MSVSPTDIDQAESSDTTEEPPSNVTQLPDADGTQHLRMLEALLFAAAEPLDEDSLAGRMPAGIDVHELLEQLAAQYERRGVNLVCSGGKWMFRTAEDLRFLLQREAVTQKRLSRAGIETLAIIAYHQPVTRAEIEEIRGVSVSKGTLDVLLETGWARLRGRKRTPGRPVTYGTTDEFLVHFGLESLDNLPGMDELKAAGLLDSTLPADFQVPAPTEADEDEDSVEDELEEEDRERAAAELAEVDDDPVVETDAEEPREGSPA